MLKYKKTKTALILIQVIAILPFLIFIFYLFDMWFDTSRNRVLETNLNEARLISLYLHENIEHGLSLARILSRSSNLIDVYQKNPEIITSMMKSITENNPNIYSIALINNEGITLQFESLNPSPRAIGLSVADREYFQRAMASQESYVSEPLIGKLTGTNIITMADPVIDRGEVTAVVASSVNLETLKSQVEKYMTDSEMKYVYILDRSDNLVFSPFQDKIDQDLISSFKDESFLKESSRGREVLLYNRNLPILKQTVIGAVVPVKEYQWTVISVQPTADIFAPLFKLQSIAWLVLLSSLAFAILIISYYIKKIKFIL